MAESRIDPLDVGALERSVNDSATRVSAIWLSFVAFTAYLAAAASNISHRQIFLEEPIKLPTINIDLPLVASAILLPMLFVIYHIYVLLQVVLLARTAAAYNEAMDHAAPDAADSIRVRQRLANTLFAQLFAGSPREREGVLGWLLRAMTWITLAIAPVFVLIVFEIKFLPYHSPLVTWTHRGLIALDLLAILLLWAGAVDARRDIALRSLVRDWKTAFGAAVIVVFTCVAVTFPGEAGRFWVGYVEASNISEGEVPECRIPWVFDIVGPGYDRLVLRGEDFVDDDKLKRIADIAEANGQKAYGSERSRIFQGRDLRCGRFSGADLRRVDFSQSDLTGAIMRGAHLEGATFPGARLNGAILDGAQLREAFFGTSRDLAEARVAKPKSDEEKVLDSASAASADATEIALNPAELSKAFLRNAQMQGAHLNGVDLAGSDLTGAQLQTASLDNASMQQAKLTRAALSGARLSSAQLQKADLQGTNLDGASLEGAQLQGATLTATSLRGASLRNAELQGVRFYGARLEGAVLYRTQLQGAFFDRAFLRATAFLEAQLQGARFNSTPVPAAIFARSFHWDTKGFACSQAHLIEPNTDPIVEMLYNQPIGNTHQVGDKPIPAESASIAEFVQRKYAKVPDSEALQKNLTAALAGGDADAEANASRLRTCAAQAATRAEAHAGEVTSILVRLICAQAPTSKYIGFGIFQNWIDDDAATPRAVSAALVRALGPMDGKECPGVELYDAKIRERLAQIAAMPTK